MVNGYAEAKGVDAILVCSGKWMSGFEQEREAVSQEMKRERHKEGKKENDLS